LGNYVRLRIGLPSLRFNRKIFEVVTRLFRQQIALPHKRLAPAPGPRPCLAAVLEKAINQEWVRTAKPLFLIQNRAFHFWRMSVWRRRKTPQVERNPNSPPPRPQSRQW